MPRTQPRHPNELTLILDTLTAWGSGAPDMAQRLALLHDTRRHSDAISQQLDAALLERASRLREGLETAQHHLDEARMVLEKLSSPPLHPAVFLRSFAGDKGPVALVSHGGARRVVVIADDVNPSAPAMGDEVLLSDDYNVLLRMSPFDGIQSGETAVFERRVDRDRIAVRSRDEQLVVYAGRALRDTDLETGDLLRWDRATWIAHEKIDRARDSGLFLRDVPTETFEDVGGLDGKIQEIIRPLAMHFLRPDLVKAAGLRPVRGITLHGPPGVGKTMVARALANWMATAFGAERAQFCAVKPGELHSAYYSESEANYREIFRIAREAGAQHPDIPVVLFFDEFESIAGSRGQSLHRIDDKVLNSFLAELDGLADKGNILVIAATNRLDIVDTAAIRPGRLGDIVLEIPRPDRSGTGAILRKYLPETLPVLEGGDPGREVIVEAAVNRIFASGSESEVARLMFRDGHERTLRAGELVSGAVLAKIAQSACRRACERAYDGDDLYLTVTDILTATGREIDEMAVAITPRNCRSYVGGLPDDVDVVRVDRVRRRTSRPERFLRVA